MDAQAPIPKEFIENEIARSRPFYLLLYSLGPADRSQSDPLETARAGHLQHLFQLRRQGALVLHGPAIHPGPPAPDFAVRGFGIFAAGSREQVEAFGAADPMVAAGYLDFVVYPFRGLPGDALPAQP